MTLDTSRSANGVPAVRALADTFAAAGALGPAAVWRHFDTLCTTPRISKQEAVLRQRLQAWADARGLASEVDTAGNLILRKAASAGCEAAPGVIMQGHLDMVCQANSGFAHDFARDPVPLVQQDGWIVAPHTTLGADNGIGVALALAVLEQDNLRHGPLEVLLTVDEEAGMGGAQGLAGDTLHGRFLINIDTEQWGEFYIGCAGGLDVDVTRKLARVPLPPGRRGFELAVGGLVGGHSGIDIHRGRGQANKLLVRALRALEAEVDLRLVSLSGGTARNALAREAQAYIALPELEIDLAQTLVQDLERTLRAELAGVDEGIYLRLRATDLAPGTQLVAAVDQSAVLAALHAAPVGVRRMSASVPGVVETSNNLGVMCVDDTGFSCNLMVRSLVDSAAQALGDELGSLFALAGCEVALGGHYPGWRPAPASPLLQRCQSVFAREFAAQHGPSRVQVIHAGLECGIIGATYPQLDMVSFGPTIHGAHAPGERVEIESVSHCWRLLTAILDDLADA